MPTKPPRLHLGDTVGIVAPASPPDRTDAVDRAVAALEDLGFKVKLGRNIRKRKGFLAGTDEQRASDLMQLFQDTQVRAIFCLRGGYGSARLLALLDFNCIRRNPKIFVGYSDITALHGALLRQASLVTFHGPMLGSDLAKPDADAFTVGSFLNMVTEPKVCGSIGADRVTNGVTILRRGVARGRLVGGNLSILCSLLGTPFMPPFKGGILFFEEIGEEPYRLDRMLTQLLNAGLLQQLAGVAIGMHINCEDSEPHRRDSRQTVQDVLRDRLMPLRIPIVMNFPFGHVRKNATVPLGIRALLDGNRGELSFCEPAVR